VQLRFVIFFLVAVLFTSALFAQDKTQPTVDELVAKIIEAKGGATTVQNLQSLRVAGKMLVQQGQIELGYLQTKKRPDEVRTEASLQGMTQIQAYDGKEGWRVSPFFGRKDPERMSADDVKAGCVFVPTSIEAGPKGASDKQRIIIDKLEANVPVDDAIFHFPGQISLPQPQR